MYALSATDDEEEIPTAEVHGGFIIDDTLEKEFDGGSQGTAESACEIPTTAMPADDLSPDGSQSGSFESGGGPWGRLSKKKRMAFVFVLVGLVLASVAVAVAIGLTFGKKEGRGEQEVASVQQEQEDTRDGESVALPSTTTTLPPPPSTPSGIINTDEETSTKEDPFSSQDFFDSESESETTLIATNPHAAKRFNPNLPPFDRSVTTPYSSCEALRDHVKAALQNVANMAIDENVQQECKWWGEAYGTPYGWGEHYEEEETAFHEVDGGILAAANTAVSNRVYSADDDDENGYDTNNQIDKVDEGDLVKTNGTWVFVAYGKEVVVLDLNGNVLDRVTVPQGDLDSRDSDRADGGATQQYTATPQEAEEQQDPAGSEEAQITAQLKEAGTPQTSNQNKGPIPILPADPEQTAPPSTYIPRLPRMIRSLLLDPLSNTLLVITTPPKSSGETASSVPGPVNDGGNTTAFLYSYNHTTTTTETSENADSSKLQLLQTIPIRGSFTEARLINSTVHLVTKTTLETSRVKKRLWRCTLEFYNFTNEVYEETALEVAEEYVEELTGAIMQGLGLGGSGGRGSMEEERMCSNVMRISSMSSSSVEGEGEGEGEGVNNQPNTPTEPEPNSDTVQTSNHQDGNRHRRRLYTTSTEAPKEETFSQTEQEVIFDHTQGNGVIRTFIRVASFSMSPPDTDQEFQVGMAGAFLPTTHAETFMHTNTLLLAGRGRRQIWEEHPESMDPIEVWKEATYFLVFGLQEDGLPAYQQAAGQVEGYLLNRYSVDLDSKEGVWRVVTTLKETWANVPTSEGFWYKKVKDASSQIYKLKINNQGGMDTIGMLTTQMGSEAVVSSARFLGSRGYLVSSEKTDPLWVVDMDPEEPSVLGELNVTGTALYLHPIGENNEKLLAIGHDISSDLAAYGNGGEGEEKRGGFEIALYDVSNDTSPQEIQKYILGENELGTFQSGSLTWSMSDATWEPHAFRYVEETQKLILPLKMWNFGEERQMSFMDGFVVYHVDEEEGIRPVGQIVHGSSEDEGEGDCYGPEFLASRSMGFDGSVMTFKGHSVRSNLVLERLVEMWKVNLDEGREERCYEYFEGSY